jgi:hypothetical protein
MTEMQEFDRVRYQEATFFAKSIPTVVIFSMNPLSFQVEDAKLNLGA